MRRGLCTGGVAVTLVAIAIVGLVGCGAPKVRSSPPKKAQRSPVVQLALGRRHSCALRADGSVSCWGEGRRGQLGYVASEKCSQAFLGAPPVFDPCSTTPKVVPELEGVTEIATGSDHTCARRNDATAWCWGSNAHGNLGFATMTTCDSIECTAKPTVVPGLSHVDHVAAGGDHTCALLDDGSVRCWGENRFGELGDGTTTDRFVPQAVAELSGVVEIALGHHRTCARKSDGTMWCWGSEGQGAESNTTPKKVASLSDVAQIDLGMTHTCARKTDATIACWGSNAAGQLGDRTTSPRSSPTLVPDLSDVAQIALGGDHTCARKNDGTVLCWGGPHEGEALGGVVTPDRATPQLVSELSSVVEIAHGEEHGCARRANGIITCWGANEWGQLGTGVASTWKKPSRVLGL